MCRQFSASHAALSTLFMYVATGAIVFAACFAAASIHSTASTGARRDFGGPLNNVSNATVAWQMELPSPQVVMNPLALPFEDIVLVPTSTTFYALNLTSGVKLWMFDNLTADDSSGYVAADTTRAYLGTLLRVYAFDLRTGASLWTFELPPKPNSSTSSDTRHARVDVGRVGGLLYVTPWYTPLLAVHSANGTMAFVGSPAFTAKEHVHPENNRIFYLGADDKQVGHVVCADARNDTVLWTIPGVKNFLMGMYMGWPVLILRRSFPITQELNVVNIYAADPPTAPLIWNRTFSGLPATFDYFYSNGIVFVATSMINDAYPNTLHALSRPFGSEMWQRTIGFYYLLAGDDAVFAFGTVTATKAYDAWTGNEMWGYSGIGVNDGAVAANKVIFGTPTRIVALFVRPGW